jgi:hypothetical protein
MSTNERTVSARARRGSGSRVPGCAVRPWGHRVALPEPEAEGREARRGRWHLACVLLLLSACAQQPPAQPKPSGPPINLSGYSPAFRQGFNEGCQTARGTARRDEQRYVGDTQYARGWDDGRAICAKR